MTDAKSRIEETIKGNDVVLYMKGTKSMPQVKREQIVGRAWPLW